MDKQKGFTLAELLVSLMLLSLLMGLLFNSIQFSTKVLDRTIEGTDRIDDLFQAQNFLRKTIEQILPEQNKFSGSINRMNFQVALQQEGGGIYDVSIVPEIIEDKLNLIFQWQSVFLVQSLTENQGQLTLAEDIEEFAFQYGISGPQQETIWIETLNDETAKNLKFVKITIESKKAWPELLIDLKLTHTNSCRYDPVSRGCIYR